MDEFAVINKLFFVFFFTGIAIIICGLIYAAFSKITKAKERKAYETMIINPSDTTVQNYIPIFLSSQHNLKIGLSVGNGGTVKYVNSEKELAEIKSRQAHGYQIIVQSPNVSDKVKEQLRRAFLSKGVPIQ